jgi:hypothetical protein
MAYSPVGIVDKNIWDFDPRIIPGCALWLDGADTYTQFQNTGATTPITENGQAINAWKDKSLSGLILTTTGIGANMTAPISAFNSQNGLPTISFTATGGTPPTAITAQGLLQTTGVSGSLLPFGRAGGTYFAVSKSPDTLSEPQMIFSYGVDTPTTGQNRQLYYSASTSPGMLISDIYGVGRSTDGTDYRSSYSILSSNMTAMPVTGATISGSQTIYNVSNTYEIVAGNSVCVNGISGGSFNTATATVASVIANTSITVNTTSTGVATSFSNAFITGNNNSFDNGNVFSGLNGTTLQNMNIGTNRATVGYGRFTIISTGIAYDAYGFNGNIAEILVYNNVLTTSERQQVEGYLAWKWGLQSNLANNHPYSIIRPLLRTFGPTDVPNRCLLWFDGADATTLGLNVSGVPTRWNDKSGNANNITSFTGTAPTYDQNTGLLTFATNTSGTTTNSIALTNNLSYSVFVVSKFPVLIDSGLSAYISVFGHSSSYFLSISRQSYTAPAASNVQYYIEANAGAGPYGFITNTASYNTYQNAVFMYSVTQQNTRNYTLSLNGNTVTSVTPSVSITSATIIDSNTTRYFVASTGSFNAGSTVLVDGIVLGTGASGYNGRGLITAVSTNVSFTASIASVAPTSGSNTFTNAIASCGTLRNVPIVIGQASAVVSTYGVGEVLLYDGGLSTQERQRVEGYLIWKWNIQRAAYATYPVGGNIQTNFPLTHPMRNFPSATVMPFSPTVITGLGFWIDAADTTSFTESGGFLSQLTDKSTGTNLNPTASAFQRVQTFNTNYPSFFGGSTGGAGVLGTVSNFTLSSPSTVFAVFQNTGNSGGPYLFNITGTSNTNRAFAYWNNQGTSNTKLRIKTGNTNDEVITSVETNTIQVFSMQMGTGATQTYTNGTIATTPPIIGATVANSTLTIGGNDATGSLTGFLAEFIIYNAALTAAQRQQVEGYLAWKWGLNTSLPTTHPYYKVPT